MKNPPKSIYLVAVAFFIAGLLCMAELLNVVFAAVGLDGLSLTNAKWVVTGYVLALCLVCYGVALLTRLHQAPQWLMVAMTLFLTVRLAVEPAGGSPFYSAGRIYLNRFVLLLPMIASTAYLLRPSFRAACREWRATTIGTRNRPATSTK